MAFEGAALIETLLLLGAGYFIISTILPRARKDILSRFISDENILNTLVYLVSVWIIASVGAKALTSFTGILDTDGQRYIGALSSPLEVVSSELGKVFSALMISAYVFIGYAILSYSKKGKE